MSSRLVADTDTPFTITWPGVSVRWPCAGSAVLDPPPESGVETESTPGDFTWPDARRLLALEPSFEFFESRISTAWSRVLPVPAPAAVMSARPPPMVCPAPPALVRSMSPVAPPATAWSCVSYSLKLPPPTACT